MRMIAALDLQRGDLVKIMEADQDKVGTDARIPVEVTHNHVFQDGVKTNTVVEMRTARHLQLS